MLRPFGHWTNIIECTYTQGEDTAYSTPMIHSVHILEWPVVPRARMQEAVRDKIMQPSGMINMHACCLHTRTHFYSKLFLEVEIVQSKMMMESEI